MTASDPPPDRALLYVVTDDSGPIDVPFAAIVPDGTDHAAVMEGAWPIINSEYLMQASAADTRTVSQLLNDFLWSARYDLTEALDPIDAGRDQSRPVPVRRRPLPPVPEVY